jgi:hypothetical protein
LPTRRYILIGMAAGALWAVIVVWGGIRAGAGAFLPPPIALPGALIAPGLVIAAMVARLAQRRFFDAELMHGGAFPPDSPAGKDQRVLFNSVEQAVLAMLIWPFVAVSLGGTVVLYMGLAFALARLAFWYGYHRNPYLRAFGFAATFYPTVLAGIWAVVAWL